MSRKIKDDRFYLTEIHKHSEKIAKELKRLKSEISETASTTDTKESVSNKFSQLELTKNALDQESQKVRFILSVLSDNMRLENISSEMDRKIAENKDLLIRLEDVYVSRKNKERFLNSIQSAISEENKLVDQDLLKLANDDREKYLEKSEQITLMKNEINSKLAILNENNEKIEFYNNRIDNPIKLSLINLIQNYEKKREERHENMQFLRSKGTVHQEEQKLLESIRETRVQLQQTELEHKNLQQQIQNVQEIIEGLDKDLQEGYSARHGKYLELMKREQKMNQFIETASERISSSEEILNRGSRAIAEGLNYWALHLQNADEDFQTDDLQTAKQDYQIQCSRLSTLKDRLGSIKTEMNTLRNDKIDLEKKLLELEDPDESQHTIESALNAFEHDKKLLGQKIHATNTAIEAAFRKNKEMTDKLSKNKLYSEIKLMELKINELEQKKIAHLSYINTLKEATNIEKNANDTEELVKIYNNLLTGK